MNKIAFLTGYLDKISSKNVLLIHGWNSNAKELKKLADMLKARGKIPKVLEYPYTLPGEKIVNDYIKPFLSNNEGADVVTHSAGGDLVRKAYNTGGVQKGRRTVMIAPPIGGSHLAKIKNILNKIIGKNDKFVEDLVPGSDFLKNIKPNKGDIAVIKGKWKGDGESIGARLKHTLVNIFNKNNDSILTDKQVSLPEASSYKTFPFSHSRLIEEPSVADSLVSYLDKGTF